MAQLIWWGTGHNPTTPLTTAKVIDTAEVAKAVSPSTNTQDELAALGEELEHSKAQQTTKASAQATSTTTDKEIELKSEKRIDYRRLQDLLKAGKWREADRETAYRMLEAVGRKKNDWIRADELRNFPCADLKTIDALWTFHSGGKFGFSVQKKIWEECGSPTDTGADWDQFCVKVGWQDETASRYLDYDELKANPDFSPRAEFPLNFPCRGCVVLCGWSAGFSSLASRLVSCSR